MHELGSTGFRPVSMECWKHPRQEQDNGASAQHAAVEGILEGFVLDPLHTEARSGGVLE